MYLIDQERSTQGEQPAGCYQFQRCASVKTVGFALTVTLITLVVSVFSWRLGSSLIWANQVTWVCQRRTDSLPERQMSRLLLSGELHFGFQFKHGEAQALMSVFYTLMQGFGMMNGSHVWIASSLRQCLSQIFLDYYYYFNMAKCPSKNMTSKILVRNELYFWLDVNVDVVFISISNVVTVL